MKLIASLAPARAEIEAGVVAKADQKKLDFVSIVWQFDSHSNQVEPSQQHKQTKDIGQNFLSQKYFNK